jgi:hypothetical protein
LLLQAAIALPLTEAALRVFGYRRTRRIVERVLRRGHHPRDAAVDADTVIASTLLAVGIANRRLPVHAACLARSVVVWGLLGRQGVSSEIVLGVRSAEHGVEAHAWVEYDGKALSDSAEYTALIRGVTE